jgi:hypothetical protein
MPNPKHTGSFRAKDDAGNVYDLDMFQQFSASGNPGVNSIRTRDGRTVDRIRKGEYRVNTAGISDTGLLLHSDDPKAP